MLVPCPIPGGVHALSWGIVLPKEHFPSQASWQAQPSCGKTLWLTRHCELAPSLFCRMQNTSGAECVGLGYGGESLSSPT